MAKTIFESLVQDVMRFFLISIDFKDSVVDQSLFIFMKEGFITYFLVYVDDIVLTTPSPQFSKEVIIKLATEFSIKDLGELKFFL